MQEWMVPAALGALTLASLVIAVVLARWRATTARELRSVHAEVASLRAQVDDVERRPTPTARPRADADPDFVITRLVEGDTGPAAGRATEPATGPTSTAPGGAERVDSALFADLVLRETVVKAASLTHGLRRALAPESRNRIRFEMGREVKRARKQRRADLKAARRHRAPSPRAAARTVEESA
jgi:hypothetical protein